MVQLVSGRAGVQPEALSAHLAGLWLLDSSRGGKVLGAVVGLQRTVPLSIKLVGYGGAVCGVRQAAHTGSWLGQQGGFTHPSCFMPRQVKFVSNVV